MCISFGQVKKLKLRDEFTWPKSHSKWRNWVLNPDV